MLDAIRGTLDKLNGEVCVLFSGNPTELAIAKRLISRHREKLLLELVRLAIAATITG